MRKALIITFGLVTLGALAGAQEASAATKRVCQTTYVNRVTQQAEICEFDSHNRYHCTTKVTNGVGLKTCFDVDVGPTPTGPWKGTTGFTKTFNPSSNTHAK
jgi:hypothetical protein